MINQFHEVTPVDKRSELTGAAIVRIVIIALVLLLIGDRIGLAISLQNFVIAIGLAAILHFFTWKIWRLATRR